MFGMLRFEVKFDGGQKFGAKIGNQYLPRPLHWTRPTPAKLPTISFYPHSLRLPGLICSESVSRAIFPQTTRNRSSKPPAKASTARNRTVRSFSPSTPNCSPARTARAVDHFDPRWRVAICTAPVSSHIDLIFRSLSYTKAY